MIKKRIFCAIASVAMLLIPIATAFNVNADPVMENYKYITEVQNDAAATGCADSKKFFKAEKLFDYGVSTFEATIKIPLPDKLTLTESDKNGYGIIAGSSDSFSEKEKAGWNFSVTEDGFFRINQVAEGYVKVFEGADLRNGEFTHIAFTYDGQDCVKYYVNGELIESVVGISLYNFESALPYCVYSDNALISEDYNIFKGEISRVTVYATCLTQEQIQEDMSAIEINSSKRKGMDLMADWVIENKNSWSITDNSDYVNNLSLCSHNYRFDGVFDENYDYSFVFIPDTQYLTLWQKERFYKNIKWITANKDKLNIKFVMHMGDLQDNSNSASGKAKQWATVSGYMGMLDNVVPYSVVLGNHDYDDHYSNIVTRNATYFNGAFPYEKYSAAETFGGAFEEGKMDNVYHKLSFDGINYMVFALEYSPRTDVLRWVDKVIGENPNYRIIITTHAYLDVSGLETASPSSLHGQEANSGASVWDMLVRKHKNIMGVFSGHICQTDVTRRVFYGDNGNKVFAATVNFQNIYSGVMPQEYKEDDAFLVIAQVNEQDKKMRFSTYMPEYDKFYNLQNQFVYDFSDDKNPALTKDNSEKKNGCGSSIELSGTASIFAFGVIVLITVGKCRKI